MQALWKVVLLVQLMITFISTLSGTDTCWDTIRIPVFCDIVRNFAYFNRYIFSTTTCKIVGATLPLYVMSRALDRPIHHHFYDPHTHRNEHQLPHAFHHALDAGLGLTMVSLAMLSFSSDEHLQRVAQLYAVTLPYTWLIKVALKHIHHKGCRRPKNQLFKQKKKYYGGFPSGHMMEAVYTTLTFGTEIGPLVGIPLGLFTGLLAADLITCNRHFLSQIVVGTSLGVIFYYAARRTIAKSTIDACFQFSAEPNSITITCNY